jgi:hypothetical protein
VNVSKAVLAAEDALVGDAEPVSDRPLDDDWLYRWRDYAAGVAGEEMLQLWGRVLAGEVKHTGAYGLRTLDFLRSMSKFEAEVIERAAQFVIDRMIWSDEGFQIHKEHGVSYRDLLLLQDLGLVSGVEGMLRRTWAVPVTGDDVRFALRAGNRALSVGGREQSLTLHVLSVSNLGSEVFKLCRTPVNERFMRRLGGKFKEAGFEVALGDVQWQTPEACAMINLISL